jgi:23S rRNA (guanosine2251-2'-O)-methyltransferase
MKKQIVVILDNIRSTYNVGSIFRTSDAVGVVEIALCGISPQPIDRFGRLRNDIAKVALGAEETVSWQGFTTTLEAIKFYKGQGFAIAALEQSSDSVPYNTFKAPEKVALILGEETQGLSPELLDTSDVILEIPMYGDKESLNVSVAAGVALYQLLQS